MKIQIEWDTAACKRLAEAAQTALQKTGEALFTEVKNAQVMPYAQGDMQDHDTYVKNAYQEDGRLCVDIISDVVKARRLYYHPEYNFQTAKNPNAGGEWLAPWLPGGKEEAFSLETFREIFKKEAGL